MHWLLVMYAYAITVEPMQIHGSRKYAFLGRVSSEYDQQVAACSSCLIVNDQVFCLESLRSPVVYMRLLVLKHSLFTQLTE